MSPTELGPQVDTGRTEPLVWVKELVLYKSIDPIEEIRRIRFGTGLNIIQGQSDDTSQAFQSGHGIGKTTVCRLIRYCLGEKTFGQKHVIEEIKHCFPNACVGALIVVDSSEWAVIRPLASRNKECAQEGSTLDELIHATSEKRYDAFTDKLSSLVLSDVPVNESLTSGQTLQWLHVLAVCSRDQETRYDRFWNWRHMRSESGTPQFRKPKVDAGLCVRAILGLLDPKETEYRKTMEVLQGHLEQTHADIKRKRDEPSFHLTRLRNRLKADFGMDDAVDAPVDDSLLGLPAAADSRLVSLRQEVARIEEHLAPLDRRINVTAASLLEPAELTEQQEAVSEATGEGSDVLLAELEKLRGIRQFLRDAEVAYCRYGKVSIGECSYVKARVEQIDDELREQQQTTLPMVAAREQVAARLAEQSERQRSIVEQIQQRLDAMNREKNELLERRRNLNDQILKIPLLMTEILDWNSTLEGRKPNTEIHALEKEAADTEAKIISTKHNLAQLIAEQSERAKRFVSRFDTVVRQTLNDEFRGVVEIEEEGINFRIVHGESLSGEAYETLAILLADVALLFESNAVHTHHPGLLIHDSPREADLNLQIYQRLLDVSDARMRESSHQSHSPYQYIVTTTTLPSQNLQNQVVTKLGLSGGDGSLFRVQLEAGKPTTPPPSLFEETEER